jgi:phosphohistidine phosphatase
MADPKQLFVLRHAKSSWDDPGLDDHERPLAPRGRRAVKLLARHLRDERIEPALVLCSSARRTQETLAGVDPTGEVAIERALFHADADRLLERLRRVPAETPSVMVIGHNPTLQMLVLRLTGAHGDARLEGDLAEVARKFPTAALATLSFESGWSDLGPGGARLTALVRPRDLHP